MLVMTRLCTYATFHKAVLDIIQRRLMILMPCFPNLLGYMHTDNYTDVERFDKPQ